MKRVLLLLLVLSIALPGFAQEEEFFEEEFSFEDMDSMFEEEEMVDEVEDESDTIAKPSSDLLTTEGVEWGGSISSSLGTVIYYKDYPGIKGLFDSKNFNEAINPSLSGSLHFNARPTEDTRFYGKFTTKLPLNNLYVINKDLKIAVPEIRIYELFSDFNYDNKVFFRVGKQNAKWGVGYFYSPADFLSLEAIDPENPEADREGPIAIKMSIPFGLNNLYTYVVVPGDLNANSSITDLIIAPMFTMLIGDAEFSTGIFYKKDLSPRMMVTGTWATNTDIGSLSFFGEGVVQYGSDMIFVKDDYTTYTVDDKAYFKATIGATWSKEILENNFSLALQYLYDGEGYLKDDQDPVTLLSKLDTITDPQLLANAVILGAKIKSNPSSYAGNRNRHYFGGSFGISNLFDNEDLSFSTFSMFNIVDWSGFINPSITYKFFDGLSVNVGSGFNIADQGDEYDIYDLKLTAGFTLGGGRF